MPKLSASLETANAFAALPKGVYNVHVTSDDLESSKKTGAPMIAMKFVIEGGEYQGREVPGMGRAYYVMAGGKRENGENHNLSRLFDTINALGAEWTCSSCGTTSTKKIVREKVKAEFQYLCPTCGKRADVSIDGSWVGLSCRAQVDVEKMQNSDDEANTVVRLFPRE